MKTKGSNTSQTALHSKIRFFPTISLPNNRRITVRTTSITAAPIILHKTHNFVLSSHSKKKTSLKVKTGAQVHWMHGNLHPKISKDIRIYFVPTRQERPSCCSVPLQQPQLRVSPHGDSPSHGLKRKQKSKTFWSSIYPYLLWVSHTAFAAKSSEIIYQELVLKIIPLNIYLKKKKKVR